MDYAALLSTIEIPDCNCGPASSEPPDLLRSLFSPPCEHVLAADHDLSNDDWIALQKHVFPEEFPKLSEPPDAMFTLETAERVDIMAERHRLGYLLWGPLDLGKDGLPIGTKAVRGANGRASSKGIATDNPEHDRDALIDEALESYYEAAADRAAMRELQGKGAFYADAYQGRKNPAGAARSAD